MGAYEFLQVLARACNQADIHQFLHFTCGIVPNTATENTTPYWAFFGIYGNTLTECTTCG